MIPFSSERTSISAGQKQLLTIARAMLAECADADPRRGDLALSIRSTELLIQQAMDELTEGRTSFVIAHRLSTIKNADLILVMQATAISSRAARTKHSCSESGFYAALYNSQFEQAS